LYLLGNETGSASVSGCDAEETTKEQQPQNQQHNFPCMIIQSSPVQHSCNKIGVSHHEGKDMRGYQVECLPKTWQSRGGGGHVVEMCFCVLVEGDKKCAHKELIFAGAHSVQKRT
jgi:hypothetical protein